MTSNKTTRRALFGSLMSLLLCCSMLVGTTFAWFTDTVTSTGNIIKSGSLQVEMYHGDTLQEVIDEDHNAAEGAIFNYKYWEPGYTEVKYLKVKNVGDLAFRYNLYIEPDFTGATTDAEKANLVKLAEALDVWCAIVEDGSTTSYPFSEPSRSSWGSLVKLGTLKALMANAEGADTGVILPVDGADEVDSTDTGNEIYEEYVTVCLALHMQEEAGNEYQNLSLGNGFAVKLLASQVPYEMDEFGADYDKNSVSAATGSVPVSGTAAYYNVEVLSYEGEGTATGKVATAEIPAAAVANDATAITVTVTPTTLNPEVEVDTDQGGKTFDIEVTGLKENNTAAVKVTLYVGTGLTGVKLYHYDTEVPGAVYSPDGYITFYATEFSPYTVVYDTEPVIVPPATDAEGLAPIKVHVPAEENKVQDWKEYTYAGYRFFPSNPETQTLERVYSYTAPHSYDTVEASGYADWYCDYEVSIDRDIAAGSIFLAGNYGRYGWVGFENPEAVSAGVKTKLISSVLSASTPWTYAEVVGLVKTFTCGVAQAVGSTEDLAGATFTVELCVYHPSTGVRHVVDTETYTFPATAVEVADQTEFAAAIADGETAVKLPAGDFTIPTSAVAGKEVTITGSGDNTVLNLSDKGYNVSGASITFENLKITGQNANNMSGFGIQGTTGDIVYKNCTFENATTNEYYGNVTYIGCDFIGTFYIATYAVESATFQGCTFDKTDSRALLVYSHGDNPVKVTVEDCTFKADAKGYTWVPEWTAAIEVDTTNIPSAGTTVTIKGCTYDENYNGIVRDKSASGKETAVITVDGVTVDNTTIKTTGYAC